MLTAALTTGYVVLPATGRTPRRSVVMQQPGSAVDPEAIGWFDRIWKKRDDTALTDDGACFIVADDESPDPSKSWFFCSDPSTDESVQCELVPEWMGQSPDGGHAVWMCSSEKPAVLAKSKELAEAAEVDSEGCVMLGEENESGRTWFKCGEPSEGLDCEEDVSLAGEGYLCKEPNKEVKS